MNESRTLAEFCSHLEFRQIPPEVVQQVLDLMLDWAGSCLAGSRSRQADVFAKLAREMGPSNGPSHIIGRGMTTSPMFAAMVNGAASHVVEQDDLHNSSVFHPATVVFPAVVALAEARSGTTGQDLITAAVAGYESGIRIGEFLGQSHYRIFHTTGTAGTLSAAMASARMLGLDETATLHALGSAGTQAAGLWEFLGDAADSKQLHTAKASADGLLAAWAAADGLTGASRILEGAQGIGAGMHGTGRAELLTAGLGERWALSETSFKYHASCRHTHPAADAMQKLCQRIHPDLDRVAKVEVDVYQAAKDVLGAVAKPVSIHQSKFSMGFVLALIACRGAAGVSEFTAEALTQRDLLNFHDKVTMRVDPEIQQAYPGRWCARVEITMTDGEKYSEFVDTPRGDPGNRLSRSELEQKAHKLVEYYGACSRDRMEKLIGDIWALPDRGGISDLFAPE